MTDRELRNKWPQAEFEQWKKEGFFDVAMTYTYEEYLQFRRAQHETNRRELEALKVQYDEYPNEQPFEMTEEDRRLLSECWADARQEKAKLAA